MTKIWRLFILLLVAGSLSACSTVKVGHDFDVNLFANKVEQGVTTQSQVRSWLGEPGSTGVNMGGNGEKLEEWSYYFGAGEMSDMSTARVKLLQVKFDKQGRVRSYNWSSSHQAGR
jgi:outer membrane protein assembly factor BamE (lipoprotein component of BamABCDE complex)